jgi:hypothetical protein
MTSMTALPPVEISDQSAPLQPTANGASIARWVTKESGWIDSAGKFVRTSPDVTIYRADETGEAIGGAIAKEVSLKDAALIAAAPEMRTLLEQVWGSTSDLVLRQNIQTLLGSMK